MTTAESTVSTPWTSSPEAIVAALIRFDTDTGAVVDAIHPNSVPQWLSDLLPSYALPEGIHRQNFDFVYFVAEPAEPNGSYITGVSCFKQVLSNETARGCSQRSLTVAMTVSESSSLQIPTFSIAQSILSRAARQFFELNQEPEAILSKLHADTEAALNKGTYTAPFSSALKQLFVSNPEQSLTIVKAIDAGASVMLFSEGTLHQLTSTVLALGTISGGPTTIFPYVPVKDVEKCFARHKHLLLGTNNKLHWLNRSTVSANVLVNTDLDEIIIEQGVWTDVLQLTPADKRFCAWLALPENLPNVHGHLSDYRYRARCMINRKLAENDDGTDLDFFVRDWNTAWAGIMYGFVKGDLKDDPSITSHLFHDDDDDNEITIERIWSTISEQTVTIGGQAQQGLSAISSWVGGFMSPQEDDCNVENPQSDPSSVWTDLI